MADAPEQPDAEAREHLLAILADLIALGGAGPWLAPPVEPGQAAFPEPWRATLGGVRQLLARLAWHAGLDHAIELTDARMGARPTERRPPTQLATTEVRPKAIAFTLDFVGNDDIPGTLAHEIGVAHAALHRPAGVEPYREPGAIGERPIDPDRDLERGSIAAAYLGLGVLAANAAYQQYSTAGRFNGGFDPLEYDVLRAGYVPMSALAYLLAVQATVRGEAAPPGLSPPQRDEVTAWLAALRGEGPALRARLGLEGAPAAGLSPGVEWRATAPRASLVPFAVPADLEDEPADPTPRSLAFRWRSHRGGIGFLAGAVLGVGVATLVASRQVSPLLVLVGAGAGHVLGRRVLVPRCTACASVVPAGAPVCPTCGATLRGEIARLADRLDAEERLAEASADSEAS